METYRKAIGAAITGVVGLIATFIPAVQEFLTAEVIASVTTLIATAVVYAVPNAQPEAEA